MKYSEQKIFSICIDVYIFYEGDDYDKIYEVLSTLKNKKLRMNNTLIDIYIYIIKGNNKKIRK